MNQLVITILVLAAIGYQLGRARAFSLAKNFGGVKQLHSRPVYYGAYEQKPDDFAKGPGIPEKK